MPYQRTPIPCLAYIPVSIIHFKNSLPSILVANTRCKISFTWGKKNHFASHFPPLYHPDRRDPFLIISDTCERACRYVTRISYRPSRKVFPWGFSTSSSFKEFNILPPWLSQALTSFFPLFHTLPANLFLFPIASYRYSRSKNLNAWDFSSGIFFKLFRPEVCKMFG